MTRRSYRNRKIATDLSISTDEDAPLWRKEMAEKNSQIKWERTKVDSKIVRIRIWGWLDNSPRYFICNTVKDIPHKTSILRNEKVELTYWPLRALDAWEKLGIFDTVEKAKVAAEHDHKTRKIR